LIELKITKINFKYEIHIGFDAKNAGLFFEAAEIADLKQPADKQNVFYKHPWRL
jgi:hypothetical protein